MTAPDLRAMQRPLADPLVTEIADQVLTIDMSVRTLALDTARYRPLASITWEVCS